MEGTGPQSSTHPNAPSSTALWPQLGVRLVYPAELTDRVIELRDGLLLGRVPAANTEVLPEPTVSGRHAKVDVGPSGYWLSDLGSTNGTRVNGERIRQPAYLVPQTVIRLGDVLGVVDEVSNRCFSRSDVLPGSHATVARIRELLPRAALDPAPVLISGETGTGKERLAFEVHRLSGRRGAYVALNCAELSPQLFESQLFGHERGAFTGAATAHSGLFEAAHAGTLFLDEIGELPLDLQPKLLRVLQEHEIRPVGALRARPIDVRVIAATNRVLATLVEQGKFRRDLFARLALWDFTLPPLRLCRQDLLHWVEFLLQAWGRERGLEPRLSFLPDVAERLLLHEWLDNLRGVNRLVHRLASANLTHPVGMRALAESMPELVPTGRLGGPDASASATALADEAGLNGSVAAAKAHPTTGHCATDRPTAARPITDHPAAPNPLSTVRPSREEFLNAFAANGYSVRATSKYFDRDRRQIYRWMTLYGIEKPADENE